MRNPVISHASSFGQVAQLVEQRTENPCVGGSIPPLATRFPQTKIPDLVGDFRLNTQSIETSTISRNSLFVRNQLLAISYKIVTTIADSRFLRDHQCHLFRCDPVSNF